MTTFNSIRYLFLPGWIFLSAGCLYDKGSDDSNAIASADPVLYQKIKVPEVMVQDMDTLQYGGDVRVGDLTNNQEADFLIYRAAEGNRQGATKPCFIGALDMEGKSIWQAGSAGIQPYRPGPVAIHDIDDDGETEVICFFTSDTIDRDPFSLKGIELQIRDGNTGDVKLAKVPPEFAEIRGEGPNWVHQRIFIAKFRETEHPQDFIVKLGKYLYAFDHQLNVLWTYFNPNDQYQSCPAYIPAVGDIDGDGKDEVNGGYYLLNDDGSVIWEKKLGKNMDAVAIAPWDEGRMRAFGSGFGHVLDEKGSIILKLGEQLVPHGQEMQIADFTTEHPGPEMVLRWNGHKTDAMMVSNEGEVLSRFQLNESPNNTGMTAVYWNGKEKPAVLFNGGVLWYGCGEKLAVLPDLPPLQGDDKMGWYHCIPANVCSDQREEVITYNPWDKYIYIYTQAPYDQSAFKGYRATSQQYNVRLMD